MLAINIVLLVINVIYDILILYNSFFPKYFDNLWHFKDGFFWYYLYITTIISFVIPIYCLLNILASKYKIKKYLILYIILINLYGILLLILYNDRELIKNDLILFIFIYQIVLYLILNILLFLNTMIKITRHEHIELQS